jgi:predicted NBD/HSP70 family sugar kinase
MLKPTPVTPDEVKRHNLARVLRHLHEDGELSRSDLVFLTGLNRSTIGSLVSDLAGADLVEEVSGVGGSRGRPSLVVRSKGTNVFVLAFDLRVDRIVCAAIGLGGEVLATLHRPRLDGPYPVENAITAILESTDELFAKLPLGAVWAGVGIAIPGVVETELGFVRKAPNLGWIDVPFGKDIESALRAHMGVCPSVVLGNDANLGAIAEYVRGAATTSSSVVYLSGDVGVGGGVVLGGQVLTGGSGYAGELGHLVVNPNGQPCNCGSQGCWETEVGRDAILAAAGLRTGPDAFPELLELGKSDPVKMKQTLNQVGEWVGVGLVNLMNSIDPNYIVLGGHLADIYPYISEAINRRVDQSRPDKNTRAEILLPSLSLDSPLVGAAEVAFGPLLSHPLQEMEQAFALV